MYQLNIVIVEDDPRIGELLKFNLQNNDYEPHLFEDGLSMLGELPQLMPVSLFILDIMLPGIDGFEICRRLKGNPDTEAIPVLMLSARGTESDRIRGLTIGADDYMTKPFGIRELLARVEALLRRYGRIRTLSAAKAGAGGNEERASAGLAAIESKDAARAPVNDSGTLAGRLETSTALGQEKPDIAFGTIRIDHLRHRVFVNGLEVEMTNREYELLKFLAQHPGIAFSRDQLLREVWGHQIGFDSSDTRTVDIHIHQVRRKIETGDPSRVQIETLRGFGYRLIGTLHQLQKPLLHQIGSM